MLPLESVESGFPARTALDRLLAHVAALTTARDEADAEVVRLHGIWERTDRALRAAEQRAEQLAEALEWALTWVPLPARRTKHSGEHCDNYAVAEALASSGRPAGGETP